ncbi:hypothetical protein GCM10022223_41730 [Kineosporia mesophila]|uniref:Aminoglycoside phosphotransferase domain-containing protein n=2 Tax=Kineosporia mesophila TaxID=566012 RepID=A0ABP6ZV06_9ACTN
MRARLETLADRWETQPPGWWRTSTIPVSIQHGDLHDGNVAVDADGRARFFDFGDSTVAHPFSTMDLPLMLARRAGVDQAGTARLEDAYLDAFTDLAPRAELRAELHGVIELAPLLRAHNWLRALTPDEPGGTVRWDPVAADGWGRPIEHWLGQLGSSPRT